MIEAVAAGGGTAEAGYLALVGGRGGVGTGFGGTTPLSEVAPAVRSQAELVAMVQIRAADALWHRQGGGREAMAHRLAASLLLSLVSASSRQWRLSPLVRDIVALGEAALPAGLGELALIVEPLAGEPYLATVDAAAGNRETAETRFGEVVGLARAIAREIAALP